MNFHLRPLVRMSSEQEQLAIANEASLNANVVIAGQRRVLTIEEYIDAEIVDDDIEISVIPTQFSERRLGMDFYSRQIEEVSGTIIDLYI